MYSLFKIVFFRIFKLHAIENSNKFDRLNRIYSKLNNYVFLYKMLFFTFIISAESNILENLPSKTRINCNECGIGSWDIKDSLFYDLNIRETKGDGGAILILQDCTLKINQCVFDKCAAQRSGGAAYICKGYADRHVYVSDERIQNGQIQGCCFKDCYCYANDRTSSVLILSALNGELSNSNTVKCPGFDNEDGRGQMKASQITLVGSDLTYKYMNLTQGYSIYSAGVEIFETYSSPTFSFCVFSEMSGSFMTYFQYMDICQISYVNYVSNSVVDIGDSGLYPGIVFMGVGNILVENCYFVKSTFTGRGQVVVYDKIYFDINNNYATLKNCYADGQRYESERVITENCNFDVNPDIITTLAIDISNCAYFYDEFITKTIDFSESEKFTDSVQFTKSQDFSNSFLFSKSGLFSYSNKFSNSIQFSFSREFSDSFNFHPTLNFSSSFQFTNSPKFTNSVFFSKSIQFSETEKFSNSFQFTDSNEFPPTAHLPSSNYFSQSEQFTVTPSFTATDGFTRSSCFTESNSFNKFTRTVIPTSSSVPSNVFTSLSISIMMVSMRSVSLSGVFSCSLTFVESFDFEGSTNVQVMKCVESIYYLPFIIYYLSPSYVEVIQYQAKVEKKKISQSQLIGITCGSAAVFFFVLSLVYLVYNRSKRMEAFSSYFGSDESDEENNTMTVTENTVNLQITPALPNGIDDWL